MNVGVMGYYGYGNVGDELILRSLTRFLSPHRVIPVQNRFPPDPASVGRLNEFDWLILGGGGLINQAPPRSFAALDRWVDRLSTPIGVLGMGVQAVAPEHRAAIDLLIDRAAFFFVRDDESKRLLDSAEVQVAPDLSFYDPHDPLPLHPLAAPDQVVTGVSLRASRGGVDAWIDAVTELPGAKRALPFSIHPAFDDRVPLQQLDPHCASMFTPTLYGGLHVVIGTALHALVMAMHRGIPIVSIGYHPKVDRLMDEAGLGRFAMNWDDVSGLPDLWERALVEREQLHDQLLDYTQRSRQRLREQLRPVRRQMEAHVGVRGDKPRAAIPPAPVSVIVLGQGASQESIARSVRSCRRQTHPNVKVLVVASRGLGETMEQTPDGADAVVVSDGEDLSALTDVRGLVAGDRVCWLKAGAWLADDALAVLSSVLSERPDASCVLADTYLTHEGAIERKVDAHQARLSGAPERACMLVRHADLDNVQQAVLDGDSALAFAPRVPHGLMFAPASASERCVLRSALAFSRGECELGRQLLANAVQSDPQFLTANWSALYHVFRDTAVNSSHVTDPMQFMRVVRAALSREEKTLRSAMSLAHSQIAIDLAFSPHASGDRRRVRHLLAEGIRLNPRRLRSRRVVLAWLGSWAVRLSVTDGVTAKGVR